MRVVLDKTQLHLKFWARIITGFKNRFGPTEREKRPARRKKRPAERVKEPPERKRPALTAARFANS